jgi:FkbM family methyltransferase
VQRFGPRCGLQSIFKTWRPTISGNKDALIGVTWSRTSGEAVWLRPSTSDVTVFEQVFVDRDYDIDAFPQITALRGKYEELLSSGKTPVIIDCGANIGLAAVWFKHQFPRAAIVAIEPSPSNYRILLRNLAGAPGFIAIQAAVWNRTTRVRIVDETADAWAFQVEECDDISVKGGDDTSAQAGIATITIEQALERVTNGALFIVKIDIEGSEDSLFASNTDWLSEVPLLIIELHDWMLPWRGTSRNFLRAMTRFDRDMVQKGENLFWFRPPPSRT